MAKMCKRQHASSMLPGGRKKDGSCKECEALNRATPEYKEIKRAYDATPEAKAAARMRRATSESKAWRRTYEATPERKAVHRAHNAAHPEHQMLTSARKRTKERGLPLPTITLKWIVEQLRTATHCPMPMCGGVKLERGKGKPQSNSPTLDQRDVGITYTPENTALVCFGCNSRKCDLSPAHLRWLADYASANSWTALDSEMRAV